MSFQWANNASLNSNIKNITPPYPLKYTVSFHVRLVVFIKLEWKHAQGCMMVIDSRGEESRNSKLRSNFEDFNSDFEKRMWGHKCLLLNLFWLEDAVSSSSSSHPLHLHFSGRWKSSQNWASVCTGDLQCVQRLTETALSSFCSSNTTRSWNELSGTLFK